MTDEELIQLYNDHKDDIAVTLMPAAPPPYQNLTLNEVLRLIKLITL